MRLIMSRYARSWAFQSRFVVRTLSIASNDFSARGSICSDSFSGVGEEAVERAVVVVDRLVERLQLVAADGRRRVVVGTLADAVALERDEALDRLDGLLPLLGLGVEVEHLLQQLVIVGRDLERLEVRGRSPSAGSAASRE